MKKAGIGGPLLQWVDSYLHDRSQRVVIHGKSSAWGSIEAGVPQGSVLGPLMFLIYVNDITNIVQSEIRLFADDTTLYVKVDDPVQSSTMLNQDLASVSSWSNKWLVSFNPKKLKHF